MNRHLRSCRTGGLIPADKVERPWTMASGNELTELYDSLAVLYDSVPSGADSDWKLALRSVLYGDELLADEASCYGAQQKKRNLGKRKKYAQRHGNGNRITDFSAITVAEPRQSDRRYVPTGAQLPVAPASSEVLPVEVTSNEVEWALSLLAEFPAEPSADRPGDGVTTLLDPQRVHQTRDGPKGGTTHDETTVLFVSDTHIGYTNRSETGRGSTVPWITELSSEEAFRRIGQIAIRRDVDAIIHTGDLLDHEVDKLTLDSIEVFLSRLSASDIPMYCIIGSHDHGAANPRHSNSVDGIAWLKSQVLNGHITELSTEATSIAGGAMTAYGISAGNVGIDDVGNYHSREWHPSAIAFGASGSKLNVLCLHDGLTPYRTSDADVDLNQILRRSRVSFDLVLMGDEHRPKNGDFETGYTFKTDDGTPVFYTGPAMRISEAYRDHDAFVTELSISESGVTATRHSV